MLWPAIAPTTIIIRAIYKYATTSAGASVGRVSGLWTLVFANLSVALKWQDPQVSSRLAGWVLDRGSKEGKTSWTP
jgi:hypothetical protein